MAVGTFDGLHLGHRAILDTVFRETRRRDGSSVVLTFDRHPQAVLSSGLAPPMILSRQEKREALDATGLETLIELPFTEELARTPPDVFVKKVLVEGIGCSAIVMGHDHRFGRGGAGEITMMRGLGLEMGFDVLEVGPTMVGGIPVSSTRLRRSISEGDVVESAALLGRPYSLRGEVVRGDGRGGVIGIPTANVRPDSAEKLLPADGVYAVRVQTEGEGFAGVCNIGQRPTFGGVGRTVEVHLLDFSGDLYGRSVDVLFHSRLRPERRFPDANGLVRQIQADITAARQILGPGKDPFAEGGLGTKIA